MTDIDPFEHLLKQLLEKDTVQCNAWKDEVQNILIFVSENFFSPTHSSMSCLNQSS